MYMPTVQFGQLCVTLRLEDSHQMVKHFLPDSELEFMKQIRGEEFVAVQPKP